MSSADRALPGGGHLRAVASTPESDDIDGRFDEAVQQALDRLGDVDPEDAGVPAHLVELLRSAQLVRRLEQEHREVIRQANR